MRKVAVYGTGASALALLSELDELEVLAFYETTPKKKVFQGSPVYSGDELTNDLDHLYIASMFFPEILESVKNSNFPVEKISIAVAHRDDPRFGTLRLSAIEELSKLDDYRAFRNRVEHIESVVSRSKPFSFHNRLDHLLFAFSHAPKVGFILEFGVYRGESLLHLAKVSERPVWGFDSFCGFQDGSVWSEYDNEPRIEMQLPDELSVYPFLVGGYFDQTLDKWLEGQTQESVAFVHYDAGHYDAAKFVLKRLKPILSPRSVIVFDEFIPSPTELRANEFDALNDEFGEDEYKIISRSGQSVAVMVS